MTSRSRVGLLLGLIALALSASPAIAQSREAKHAARAASPMAGMASPALVTSSPPPCSDSKYNLIGPKWKSTLKWSYKSSTTPSYLTTSQVVQVLKRAFNNITMQRNDCGRADRVSATWSYLGTTSRNIGVTKAGACGSADGHNTIGFGALPAGYLALTCVRSVGTSITETDIRFGTGSSWALALSGCFNDYMLEAVATHEIGHAFGLDHVGETNHGRLTMSTFIDGTCENQESTLGLGDMKALEALY
jgi:matrixin